MVHLYRWGQGNDDEDYLEVFVDTDFAGCKETRRSTSGGVCLLNGANVKQWSKTQTTLALSSGEAELHGINAGICQGLGHAIWESRSKSASIPTQLQPLVCVGGEGWVR